MTCCCFCRRSQANYYYVLRVRKDTETAEIKQNYFRLRCGLLILVLHRLVSLPPSLALSHARTPRSSAAALMPPLPPCCSRLVHPDKCSHPQASEAAATVNQAYGTLSNALKKRECSA